MVPFSRIYIHRERTMIDLGQMKNCLNCSYFTLMLNAVKQGSTEKLLTTAKGEIKPFMTLKKCPPSYPFLKFPSVQLPASARTYMQFTISVLLNVSFSCRSFLWYAPSYIHHVFLTSSCIISVPPLHFSPIVFSLSHSHPSLCVSAPVSRLGETGEPSIIKVPARSHQFTLSLTDPCAAAQYIKKEKRKQDHPLV